MLSRGSTSLCPPAVAAFTSPAMYWPLFAPRSANLLTAATAPDNVTIQSVMENLRAALGEIVAAEGGPDAFAVQYRRWAAAPGTCLRPCLGLQYHCFRDSFTWTAPSRPRHGHALRDMLIAGQSAGPPEPRPAARHRRTGAMTQTAVRWWLWRLLCRAAP